MSPLIFSNNVAGERVNGEPTKESVSGPSYSLTIEENMVSLKATDASLKKIIEDIGKRMKIEVNMMLPEDEKVTVEFDKLPLKDALERLSSNYAYLTNSEKQDGRITKIMVLPKGEGTGHSRGVKVETIKNKSSQSNTQVNPKKEQQKPEPFKFGFDPSQHMKGSK